ncbi:MAG: Ig-like domain-containing protein [Adhaeribacter sp.]
MKGTCTKLFLLCLLCWLCAPLHPGKAQTISTVAGSGTNGGGGDGSPAVFASVNPMGVAVDAGGNIYIADTDNNRIRKVTAGTGVISTIAGTGSLGFSGDGGLAIHALLNKPYDVALDGAGNIFFSDQNNNRIRRISASDGKITTVAGSSIPGSGGDLGPATSASLNRPTGLALDPAGNLFIADQNNHRIRKVDALTGLITTVAGTGAIGFSGDGAVALMASMRFPLGIALDAGGNIYFADSGNNRVRKISALTGTIQTIAGNGAASSFGDGNLATAAALNKPAGLAISGSGTLFISEQLSNRVRKVNPANGKIYPVAGPGTGGWSGYVGDNGPAINAVLNGPTMIDVDADANIFVADYYHMRIRRIEGLVNQGLTLVEGESGSLSAAVLEFIDTTQPATSVTYTLTGIPSKGLLFRDDNGNDQADAGEALAVSHTFSQENVNAGLIKYKHDGSETTADNFGFSVADGAGKSVSGKTFVFTIRKFNDAPVLVDNGPASWSTPEDVNLALAHLQIEDPDAGNDLVSLEISVAHGVLQIKEDVMEGLAAWDIQGNQSQTVLINAQLSAINATLADGAGLVFVPDLNFNGSGEVRFGINDNGSTSTGINGSQFTSFSKPLSIQAVNDQPVITSNGGGASASLSLDEQVAAVTTVAATDVANENSTLTYSLSGGADQALFQIDPGTGALSFVTAPLFRQPADAGADNSYQVKVKVTDDGSPAPFESDEQEISVTVLDKTPPRVLSVLRLTPTAAITKADPVVFRVSFDEAVSHVDASDFLLTRTGSAAGSIAAVSAGSGTQVDVTVSGVSGDGMLRLEVKASGSDIADAAGLVLAGGFTTGEAYTIDNTAPVITGVENGLFYANDRQVNFNEGAATLNGSSFYDSTTVSEEGHYTLAVTDEAGNASTLSFDIDKTAPAGTLVINGAAAQTRETGLTLALTQTDGPGSQTAGMRFSADNSSWTAWEPFASSRFFELPAGDGLKTVYLQLQDAVGNVSASIRAEITLDQTLPTIALSSVAARDSVNAPFPVTIAFSEAVSGFEAADLVITNGTASAFTALDAQHYTVLITPTAEGWTKVALPENRAQDQAANGNEAAETLIRFFDATRPAVVIGGPAADPVNAPFTATFTFSEPVSGFAVADLQVSNATVSGFQSQNAKVYQALISPLNQGPVTVAVAAGVAADPAGNANQEGAALTRHYDAIEPQVSISAPAADPVNAPFTATITFSEAVTGFEAADLQVSNGAVSGFTAQSATIYTALITPAADGLVTLAVGADAAADAAGNGSEAAALLSRSYDATRPAVALSAPAADPVNAAFTATFTFSEAVSGFDAADVQVSNGAVSNLQAQSAAVYTALITPAADGPVAIVIGADAAADAAGNGNQAPAPLSRNYDGTRPALALSAPAADPANAAFTVTFTFSEPVSGFTLGDVAVGNGTASGFTAQSAAVYTALITPAADGMVTVAVAANAASDAAANGSEAAVALSRTYDATKPVLTLAAAAPAQVNAAFPVTFTFSEAVTGFEGADLQVSNGTASGFTAQSARVYTALITPAADGPVHVAVGTGAAVDAAGNGSTAAAPLSRTYDATVPAVTLASTAPAETNASPIPVSISFSEAVSGFAASDITVSNGAVTGFSAVDAKTYQVLISPGADGPVSVQVAAQVAADAAGNANTASNQLQHQFDGSQPQVVIASAAPAWVNAAFPVSFTFNEPVTGFSAGAITLVNASLSGFTALSATQYTAILNPVAAGLVSVSVGAGKAKDAAANGNQASQVLSRNYDAVQPAVTLASATGPEVNAPFQVQISFSEAVTGFDLADILVSNGQASGFAQSSAQAYSALITPAGEGQVQVQVAAGAATDQAGNASSASLALGRTYDATRPSVVLSSTAPAVTNVNPVPVSISFSEAVMDFVVADITVTGGTVSSLTGSGANYQMEVVPSGDGLLSVQVAADVARDKASNGNLASNVLSRTYDGSQPSVVVTAITNELNRLPFVATITFSEPVTGFVMADLSLANATASNFQALSPAVYTVLITPAPLGTVVVKVPEKVAFDQLQNGNLASLPLVLEDIRCGNNRDKVLICHKGQMICVALSALPGHLGHGDNIGSCKEDSGDHEPTPPKDVTKPEVVISAPVTGPVQSAFTATFTFSEPVSGFALNDIGVSNGSASSFQAQSAMVYTALITPAANGMVTVGVDANAAADAANNGNIKAASLLLEFLKCGSSVVDIDILRKDKDAGNCAGSHSCSKDRDHDKNCGKNTYPTAFKLDLQTIYLGYGDQTLELDATGGASAGTTYAWTGNGVLSSKTSGKPVFAPTSPGVYTFQVVATSRNGCKASGSVTLTVVDVRYGPKKDKIAVCHNGQVVGLSSDQVAAHLAHGDKLGSCSSGKFNARLELVVNQAEQVELGIYPNPARVKTNIEFTLVEAGSYRLALYDLKGTLVKEIAAGQGESQQFISRQLDVSAYPQGVYLIRLSTSGKGLTSRLLIEK